MIYLVSFIIFLLFFFCLSLGFILQKKGLKSESEANAILEGLTCASCTASCGFAGSKRKPTKNCKATIVFNKDEELEKIPSKKV